MAKEAEFRCKRDKNTKELVCRSFRKNTDGSKTELASLRAKVDGDCKPDIRSWDEHYPGEFDRLERKVNDELSRECHKTTKNDF